MLTQYFPWKSRYHGLTPLAVRNRRRHERGKRRAITAAFASVLIVLSIGVADMLIWPDPSESPESSAPANAPETLLASRQTAPAAAAVRIPLPMPNLQNARASTPAPVSPPVRQPSPGVGVPLVSLAARTTPVKVADIRRTDPAGYVVQVAAAPQLQEARAVLAQLAETGHPAYVTAKIVDGVELYRVRVGPFKSRSGAEDVARRLVREGHHAPWVTK